MTCGGRSGASGSGATALFCVRAAPERRSAMFAVAVLLPKGRSRLRTHFVFAPRPSSSGGFTGTAASTTSAITRSLVRSCRVGEDDAFELK